MGRKLMNEKERTLLSRFVSEMLERRHRVISKRIKVSEGEIERLYSDMPSLLKKAVYRENIDIVVERKHKNTNDDLFKVFDDIIKKGSLIRKKPSNILLATIVVVIASQLFLIFG